MVLLWLLAAIICVRALVRCHAEDSAVLGSIAGVGLLVSVALLAVCLLGKA